MKNILVVAIIALITSGCAKQITVLPEQSQTGSNTFGAKINGSLWGPMKFGIASTAPILEARFADDNSIYIHARNFGSSPNESEMEIYLKNLKGAGTIQLNQATGSYPQESASYALFLKRKIYPTNEWITNAEFTGTVNITHLDRAARIISGTFEFNAGPRMGSDGPITVTEGRFDVRIQ